MKKDIVIYDPILVKALLRQGFHIKNIAPDRKIKNGTVFFFNDTEAIRSYLKKEWDYRLP